MTSRVCLFCGGQPVTKEHIWADWIRRELSALTRDPFTVTSERVVGKKRVWTTRQFPTVSRFCDTCNSGWMSQMEAMVKPILAPMMLAQEHTAVLSPREQIILSQWVFKTALVLDSTRPDRMIPDEWYQEFYRTRMPLDPGTLIWTTGYLGPGKAAHGYLLALRAEGTRPILGDSGMLEYSTTQGFLITVTAYRAVFQVLGYFGGPWRPTRDGDAQAELFLIRMWPGTGKPVAWPKDGLAISDKGLMEFCQRGDFLDPLVGLL